jgi:hypothetical protein
MDSSNVAGIASVAVVAGIGVLGLFVLLFVIIVVANRAEPDPRGLRPLSVYLFSMSFVMLQITYAGAALIAASLISLVGPHFSPLTNGIARSVVIGGLLIVIAGSTLVFHVRKGIDVAGGDGGVDGPNVRILNTYVSVVSFLYLFTMLVALGFSIYLIFELVGPGVFGGGSTGRTVIVENLLDTVYVLVASGIILIIHSRFGAPSVFRFKDQGSPGISAKHIAPE